jgi:disulfide bond formation protein DsbB
VPAGRLEEWFLGPGPDAPPTVTLRWVRRTSIAMTCVATAGAIVAWSVEGSSLITWLLTIGAVSGATSIPGLSWAIRDAERRGPLSEEDRERGRRRAEIGLYAMCAFNCAGLPVLGYVMEGWLGAGAFFVLGVLVSVLSFRSRHRWLG